MTVALIKPTSVDPLRQSLAAAVEKAADAREALNHHRSAIERVQANVRQGEHRIRAAEKALEEAQEAHAGALAAAAADDTPHPTNGVREARQAIADAQDDVEATKTALAQLKAELVDWERAAREADIELETAVTAVLEPQMRQLLDQAWELRNKLAPIRRSLFALFNDRPEMAKNDLGFEKGQQQLDAIREEVSKFFGSFGSDIDEKTAEPWRAARERLRADPYAALNFAEPAQ